MMLCSHAQVQQMHFSRRTRCWSHRSRAVTIYGCLTNWSCFEIAQKRHWVIVLVPLHAVLLCLLRAVWELMFHMFDWLLWIWRCCILCMSECSFWLFCLHLNASWHCSSSLLSRLCINHRFRLRIRWNIDFVVAGWVWSVSSERRMNGSSADHGKAVCVCVSLHLSVSSWYQMLIPRVVWSFLFSPLLFSSLVTLSCLLLCLYPLLLSCLVLSRLFSFCLLPFHVLSVFGKLFKKCS